MGPLAGPSSRRHSFRSAQGDGAVQSPFEPEVDELGIAAATPSLTRQYSSRAAAGKDMAPLRTNLASQFGAADGGGHHHRTAYFAGQSGGGAGGLGGDLAANMVFGLSVAAWSKHRDERDEGGSGTGRSGRAVRHGANSGPGGSGSWRHHHGGGEDGSVRSGLGASRPDSSSGGPLPPRTPSRAASAVGSSRPSSRVPSRAASFSGSGGDRGPPLAMMLPGIADSSRMIAAGEGGDC